MKSKNYVGSDWPFSNPNSTNFSENVKFVGILHFPF